MKRIIKSRIFLVIVTAIICTSIGVYAASYAANDVSFTPKNTNWKKEDGTNITNVKDALDDLYSNRPSSNDFVNAEWKFPYIGGEQEFVVPTSGKYKIETWGAQGGSYNSTYIGGYGGYSVGIISLTKNDKLYINVGGKGEIAVNTTISGGYNGGGKANTGSSNDIAGSGGGATHIAISSGLLSSLENKKNDIIIVAAGGGGSYYYRDFNSSGGNAGGYLGNNPTSGTCFGRTYNSGTKANQTQGGTANKCGVDTSTGFFGHGGDGNAWASGGGAGLYGGGAGGAYGSSGGSSYIGNNNLKLKHMTCYNCETSDDTNTKTTSNECHNSEPTKDCAKEGNGYARITYIGN